ncbi:MAG TPA: HAMP domain-containing sensor histidine kinase [Candidatus Angelobacter sp.]|nr:HAMP domain-containing sensor histidine kinase [Candidatus Angelobacter sp.]
MNLRRRLVAVSAAAVAGTVVVSSVVISVLVGNALHNDVDSSLRARVASVAGVRVVVCAGGTGGAVTTFGGGQMAFEYGTGPDGSGGIGLQPQPCGPPPDGTVVGGQLSLSPKSSAGTATALNVPPTEFGAAGGYTQFVDAKGNVVLTPGERVKLPVDAVDLAVARGTTGLTLRDATVNGVHMRIATAPESNGIALQVARPLDETDSLLSTLRWVLLGIDVAGVALAVTLTWLAARPALRPVDRLIAATEHVASTHDLGRRIDVQGDGELARLARSFNEMMRALDDSERTQRQLVADASHELRTPIASLRTNLEVLGRDRRMDAAERDRLLSDVNGQLARLSRLVADLVDLARGDAPGGVIEPVQLGALAEEQVGIARSHYPAVRFTLRADGSTVPGDAARIGRAVGNLLDNAGKWSPPGGEVAVVVERGQISVRDHGPGVAPADAPRVFDRFWRAPAARRLPGSGLGLAIVRQVAQTHGGSASVSAAPDGGAVFVLRLATHT